MAYFCILFCRLIPSTFASAFITEINLMNFPEWRVQLFYHIKVFGFINSIPSGWLLLLSYFSMFLNEEEEPSTEQVALAWLTKQN